MKHNKNHNNAKSEVPLQEPVRFEFNHATARAVCIAGTFNHWHPTIQPMRSTGAGHWLKETVLAPGAYEYCLIVDGQWMPDPLAKETVPNPYGGKNSVLNVRSPEVTHLADAENLPLKM